MGRHVNKIDIMKYTAYIIAFAIFWVVSCQRVEFQQEKSAPAAYRTLSIGVDNEADTKVGFDESNSFYWHKGDKIGVLTTAGFYGVVIDINDDTVIVEFGNNKNCRIPMQRNAITNIEKPEA